MDEIFIQNPGLVVFGNADLTQRERPQAFKDAEARRIAAGEADGIGEGVLDNVEKRHTSQVEKV